MIALLLVDVQLGLQQTGYYGKERNNPQAEENCKRLLQNFREKKWPLFHVQHCSTSLDSPLYPGKEGNKFNPLAAPKPGETVIPKQVNSGFIGTNLEGQLKEKGINHVVIGGLTTEHCISTTTRMAANLGFKVTLVSDATASFNKIGVFGEAYSAEMVHRSALAQLKDEFAHIIDTETVLQSLLDTQ